MSESLDNNLPIHMQRQRAWIVGGLLPVLTGLLGLVAWPWLPYPLGTSCGLTLVALLVTVIVTDSHWKKIPNWATYPAFAWVVIFNITGSVWSVTGTAANGFDFVGPAGLGAIGIGNCLLGAVACFAVMVVLSGWLRSAGGDVKLLTVIGACVGVRYGLMALCLGYILAGCYSLLVCFWHYGFWNVTSATARWIGSQFFPLLIAKPQINDDQLLKTGVPLGAHFALGTLLALAQIVPAWQL